MKNLDSKEMGVVVAAFLPPPKPLFPNFFPRKKSVKVGDTTFILFETSSRLHPTRQSRRHAKPIFVTGGVRCWPDPKLSQR